MNAFFESVFRSSVSQANRANRYSSLIILPPIVKKTFFSLNGANKRNRSILASLAMAAVATVSQTDKAAAVDLSFNDPVQANNTTLSGIDPAFSGRVIDYRNVATGVDARITATAVGANYSFVGHAPNYEVSSTNEPNGDTALQYQIAANRTGVGGLNYNIDFFQTDGITHNFSTAYVAPALRFLVYDVDGEARQNEAVRISKNSGLVGYQLGNTPQALTLTENTTSYLFSGRNANVAETDSSGSAIFYFQGVSSVLFQFEANTTTTSTTANQVFSVIDGDLSLLAGNLSGFNTRIDTTATSGITAAAVPEPFTIIGTLVGGTAALRMRKKLKAAKA
jgi:hypothetical protein